MPAKTAPRAGLIKLFPHKTNAGYSQRGQKVLSGFTPVYKTAILVTEKRIADILIFARFLPRLSGPDHSRVVSKASFCWAHSD